MNNAKPQHEKGFSLIELLIVVMLVTILSLMAYMTLGGKTLFEADNRAYAVMDVLKEAKQRAITQQETLRVEVNKTSNSIHLYNENEPGDETDDVEIKSFNLLGSSLVNFDTPPTNIAGDPVEPTPVPMLDFKTSVYSPSAGNQVATLRFLRNGNVHDAGSNTVGDNSIVTGATIFLWMPKDTPNGPSMTEGKIIRAITVLGTSGTARYWKCTVSTADGMCSTWKN